jgi:hypothetical protein
VLTTQLLLMAQAVQWAAGGKKREKSVLERFEVQKKVLNRKNRSQRKQRYSPGLVFSLAHHTSNLMIPPRSCKSVVRFKCQPSPVDVSTGCFTETDVTIARHASPDVELP